MRTHLALTAGPAAVNTVERLRCQAGETIGLGPGSAGFDAAFSHILRLRLTQQVRAGCIRWRTGNA